MKIIKNKVEELIKQLDLKDLEMDLKYEHDKSIVKSFCIEEFSHNFKSLFAYKYDFKQRFIKELDCIHVYINDKSFVDVVFFYSNEFTEWDYGLETIIKCDIGKIEELFKTLKDI